jgi:hypothetical protein
MPVKKMNRHVIGIIGRSDFLLFALKDLYMVICWTYKYSRVGFALETLVLMHRAVQALGIHFKVQLYSINFSLNF